MVVSKKTFYFSFFKIKKAVEHYRWNSKKVNKKLYFFDANVVYLNKSMTGSVKNRFFFETFARNQGCWKIKTVSFLHNSLGNYRENSWAIKTYNELVIQTAFLYFFIYQRVLSSNLLYYKSKLLIEDLIAKSFNTEKKVFDKIHPSYYYKTYRFKKKLKDIDLKHIFQRSSILRLIKKDFKTDLYYLKDNGFDDIGIGKNKLVGFLEFMSEGYDLGDEDLNLVNKDIIFKRLKGVEFFLITLYLVFYLRWLVNQMWKLLFKNSLLKTTCIWVLFSLSAGIKKQKNNFISVQLPFYLILFALNKKDSQTVKKKIIKSLVKKQNKINSISYQTEKTLLHQLSFKKALNPNAFTTITSSKCLLNKVPALKRSLENMMIQNKCKVNNGVISSISRKKFNLWLKRLNSDFLIHLLATHVKKKILCSDSTFSRMFFTVNGCLFFNKILYRKELNKNLLYTALYPTVYKKRWWGLARLNSFCIQSD